MRMSDRRMKPQLNPRDPARRIGKGVCSSDMCDIACVCVPVQNTTNLLLPYLTKTV